MSVPEAFKNAGTLMKAMIENAEISSAVAETIKGNQKIIVGGAIGLSALYLLKESKFDFKMKAGDIEVELEKKE